MRPDAAAGSTSNGTNPFQKCPEFTVNIPGSPTPRGAFIILRARLLLKRGKTNTPRYEIRPHFHPARFASRIVRLIFHVEELHLNAACFAEVYKLLATNCRLFKYIKLIIKLPENIPGKVFSKSIHWRCSK